MPERLRAVVGVMAYEEEATIGPLLESLKNQDPGPVEVVRVLVVVSPGTDATAERVCRVARSDPRVVLCEEPARRGKAAAVNRFLGEARRLLNPHEVVVLAGADGRLAPGALAALLRPFVDPEVGMTGGRPVPVNDPQTFWGYVAHLVWNLHHEVAQARPKCGELVAVRVGLLHRIPPDTLTDELVMEPLVRGQGYSLVYCPRAVVQIRGPENADDFLEQRSRIYEGHLRERARSGYAPPTMAPGRLLLRLPRALRGLPARPHWLAAALAWEARARLQALFRVHSGRPPRPAWKRVASTKRLAEER